MKRFQLMQRVNVEGLYGAVQECLPYLQKAPQGGRIVVVCPPIYSRFFRGKTAYAIGKVGMSVLVKGLGMDFEREEKEQGAPKGHMAVVGVWPAVVSPVRPTILHDDDKWKNEVNGCVGDRVRCDAAIYPERPSLCQASSQADHLL